MAEKPTYEEFKEPCQNVQQTRNITELKQAEETTIKRNESLQSKMVANIGDVIVIIDQDGINRYKSPNIEKLFGWKPEEVVGASTWDNVHPEDLESTQKFFETLSHEFAAVGTTECRYKCKDGGYKWIQFTGSNLLHDPDIQGILGNYHDITDRKQAGEELRYRSKIENAIAQSSSIFVSSNKVGYSSVLQVIGECVSANRAYIFEIQDNGCRMSNISEWCAHGTDPKIEMLQSLETSLFPWWMEQLRAGKDIIIKDVDNLPPEAAAEKEILQAQQILSVISVPIWLEENVLWGFMGFDDTDTIRKWSNSEIEALQIVGEMITTALKRKVIDDKLLLERKQLLSIFDSIDESIYVSDPYTHEILFVNQSMRNLFSRDLVGGLCYKEIQNLDSRCEFCTNDIILKQMPEPYRWEFYNQNIDKTFDIIDRIIKWPDGRNVRFEIAIDITDRKKMEEQLRQSQKMESIGTLAGGIAHDFNNILYPIVGYTELAMDEVPKDSRTHEKLRGIFNSAMRAQDLVQQILTFSRKGDQKHKPLMAQLVVKEALKFMRSSIPKTIEIHQKIDIKCGLIMGDPTQVHQIVMNLCTNAYHAIEESGGKIEVTLTEIEFSDDDTVNKIDLTPGRYIQLSVSDTGQGMTPDIIGKIFDPYFTTKENGKGTGLGLSVIHGIVKNHDGDICVYSEPGIGTIFHVYFPLIEKDLELNTTSTSKVIQTGNEHVLLVDDEEPIIKMEQQMLARLGYKVTTRTSSIEALEAFRATPNNFDFIITDMTMPNMTGIELAKKMIKIRKDIPIMICTGFSERMDEEKARSIGIRSFIMKPIIKSDLAKKIRDVLDNVTEE